MKDLVKVKRVFFPIVQHSPFPSLPYHLFWSSLACGLPSLVLVEPPPTHPAFFFFLFLFLFRDKNKKERKQKTKQKQHKPRKMAAPPFVCPFLLPPFFLLSHSHHSQPPCRNYTQTHTQSFTCPARNVARPFPAPFSFVLFFFLFSLLMLSWVLTMCQQTSPSPIMPRKTSTLSGDTYRNAVVDHTERTPKSSQPLRLSSPFPSLRRSSSSLFLSLSQMNISL